MRDLYCNFKNRTIIKNAILFLSVLALSFGSCSSDDDATPINEIPNGVTAAFKAEFPKATDVEYVQLGTDHEVEFDVENVDHKALYSQDGKLIRHKYDIRLAQLPEAIKKTVVTDFENKSIDDTEILMQNGLTFYQVELDKEPNDLQLVFNKDGAQVLEVAYWD